VSLSRDHDHADGGGPSKAGTKTCFVSCVDKLCNTVAMLHLMFLVLLKRAVSSVLFAAHLANSLPVAAHQADRLFPGLAGSRF
jgi:hypothetical protein